MKTLSLSLVFLILGAAACTSRDAADEQVARSDSAAPRGPRPTPEAIARSLDSLAARVVDEGLTPALGVALVMDDRIVFARSYGMADLTNRVPANDSTLWYVSSTSKSLTGFGVSLLAQQGVVDFVTPITALLPQARWPQGFDAGKLTLADFLSHTHGLNDRAIVTTASFTGDFPESQWPAMLRYATLLDSREVNYSNLGYNVAAMVIDAKRPEGWRRFLDSAVYKPAGMSDTYSRISGLDQHRISKPHNLLANGRYETAPFFKTDPTMNSAGGHLATLHDLARWVTVQMGGGVIDGKRVFPAEAVALSQRMIAQHKEKASFAFFARDGWAAGWDIGSYRDEPMISRFGGYSSTRSHLSFLPRRRIGVVAQTNGDLAWTAGDILAALAYDLEAGNTNARAIAENRLQDLMAERPGVIAGIAKRNAERGKRPLDRPASHYEGSYSHEWYGTVTFEARGNDLHWRWGALNGVAAVLDARTCSWFRCKHYSALRIDAGDISNSVEFEFPEAPGPATALRMRGERFSRR